MTEPYKPKLIEVALPLMKINEEATREKSIRHGHPSTLHLWWARRPLAAARAVLWASLVDDPSARPEEFPTPEAQQIERDRLFDILERLVPWEASTDATILSEAKAEIDRCFDGNPPSILDPFGGGGTIPLEAQRLGLKALSGDLNPVAVLIQRAMIEIPSRFANRPPRNPKVDPRLTTWSGAQGLAADVEAYGRQMSEEAERRIGHLYPKVVNSQTEELTPIAWIWARTIESPDPSWSGHVPLVKTWVLRKKPKKPLIWAQPSVNVVDQTVSYTVVQGGTPMDGTVERGGGTCIATGAPIPFEYIREESRAGRLGFQMIAIIADTRSGRSYLSPSAAQQSAAEVPLREGVLAGELFDWPGRINVVRYGLTRWESLFTGRQLTALATFAEVLTTVWEQVVTDADAKGLTRDGVRLRDGGSGAEAYADAIVTYLAFALDRCAGRWCSLTAWHNGRETVEHVFRRQSIPMVWDFPEANPFSTSRGNWIGQVEWIVKCLEAFPASGSCEVAQRDARARIAECAPCVISTDPPYYDNVPYADISDFYFAWMRRSLHDVWPDELATLQTPKSEELIANRYRAGSKQAALDHFEHGMAEVFREIAAAQDPRVPSTVFYAFKQTEQNKEGRASTGWETFLQGLIDAGLCISATWPIRTEMVTGVKGKMDMLASSVVLACRARPSDARLESRGGFTLALRSELAPAVKLLQHENIAPVDLAQSAIGPGMRVFSRYSRVVEADGSAMSVRSALSLINEVLSEVLTAEEAELDADTRFALTWFEQFGHNPGPSGDADVLARAKDTSVGGVVEAGIAVSRDGRVRLLERDELEAGWVPQRDSRATVWEAAQHLILCLNESESEAAALMAQLGGVADRARQLAYLLYGVCERQGWASEAIAYNGLITAWPELLRLAVGTDSAASQQRLV